MAKSGKSDRSARRYLDNLIYRGLMRKEFRIDDKGNRVSVYLPCSKKDVSAQVGG